MDKEDVVCIYNGIILSHEKEWNNAIYSNMDATRDYHTKWIKSERERQIPYDTPYMWNLKYGANEPLCEIDRLETLTAVDDGVWVAKGVGGRKGMG